MSDSRMSTTMPITATANLTLEEKLVLATFILGNDKQRVDEINRTAFIRLSSARGANTCSRICDDLVSRGALTCVARPSTIPMRWYELQRPVPFAISRPAILEAARVAPAEFRSEVASFFLALLNGGGGLPPKERTSADHSRGRRCDSGTGGVPVYCAVKSGEG